MKGREVAKLQDELGALNPAELVERLEELGFAGIYINARDSRIGGGRSSRCCFGSCRRCRFPARTATCCSCGCRAGDSQAGKLETAHDDSGRFRPRCSAAYTTTVAWTSRGPGRRMDLAPSERLAQGPGDLFRPSLQGLPVMNPHGLIPDTAGDSRSRRAFLRAGAAGALGLTMGDGRAFSALARGPSPPARAVIMLWLWGGPSHLDTFDMKPEAPAEYRGPFEPIATAVPGIQVCELLPGLARRADKFALLRAVHHESNDHGIAGTIALTGSIAGAVGLGGAANTQAPRPSTGSIVGRLHRREAGLAASLCDPRQPAPPGTEAGRWRGRRLAREHVRPLPPRLRAGHSV